MATREVTLKHQCVTRTGDREGKGGGGVGQMGWVEISPGCPFLTKSSSPVFFGFWVFMWEMTLERKETGPMIYVRFLKKFLLQHSWHTVVQLYISFRC